MRKPASALQQKVRKENYMLFLLYGMRASLFCNSKGIIDPMYVADISNAISCAVNEIKLRQANRKPRLNPLNGKEERIVP